MIPLGREGVEIGFNLYWNMFTAAGWLSASLTFFSVLLFIIPGIFREFNHAEKEAQWIKMNGLKTEGNLAFFSPMHTPYILYVFLVQAESKKLSIQINR